MCPCCRTRLTPLLPFVFSILFLPTYSLDRNSISRGCCLPRSCSTNSLLTSFFRLVSLSLLSQSTKKARRGCARNHQGLDLFVSSPHKLRNALSLFIVNNLLFSLSEDISTMHKNKKNSLFKKQEYYELPRLLAVLPPLALACLVDSPKESD